jgi:predicted nucleotidyltransferase
MPLHCYLELLLGSKVKISVLRALWMHRNKEFTIRELAGYLALSHAGVRKALDDLEKAGAISMKTVGRAHATRIRLDSYAGKIIDNGFTLESRTIEEMTEMLEEALDVPEVISAALYGSVARRQEGLFSDVDLLIVTNRREQAEGIIGDLQRRVVSRFGNPLSPHYVSEEEYEQKKRTPLIKDILRNHILICGRELG